MGNVTSQPPHQRATKKQQELYDYIQEFIGINGFSPSYREIMQALNYKSVSTVAVHVNGLIAKGYLKKLEEGGARTLAIAEPTTPNDVSRVAHQWLRQQVEQYKNNLNDRSSKKEIYQVEILEQALQILGVNEELGKEPSKEGQENG